MEIKLNIGCGIIGLKGFINIDKTLEKDELPEPHEDMEVRGGIDVVNGLPFGDNSISAITTSHFFSTIDRHYFSRILQEWYRVLKPNGVVRITDTNYDQPLEIRKEYNFSRPSVITHVTRWIMYSYLLKAGFEVHDVCDKTTWYKDTSLIQSFHGNYTLEFHIEGIKGGDRYGST